MAATGTLAHRIGRKPVIKALTHFLVWPRQSSLLLYKAMQATPCGSDQVFEKEKN